MRGLIVAGCLLALAGLALTGPGRAAGAALEPGFEETTVLTGLNLPTAVRFAADGRVLVAEQRGVIKLFDGLGDATPQVVDDNRTEVHNWQNRGLLGLELDPGFPAEPFLYALYSRDAELGVSAPQWGAAGADEDGCVDPPRAPADPEPASCPASGRLERLRLSASGTSVVERRTLVDDWCVQFETHSVGALAFGAGGALYASGGEGADYYRPDSGEVGTPDNACGDPDGEGGALRAQDLRSSADPAGLGGTVIRVDPATGAATAGNPGGGDADPNARRIVAYGLRNPFRFAIRPGTDELWIGDVGWSTTEEIDRLAPGTRGNFGWPCFEGAARQPEYDALDLGLCESLYASGGQSAPFFSYEHAATVSAGDGCVGASNSSAVSGLAFERGRAYPDAYQGALFFADISRGCLWAIPDQTGDGVPDPGAVSRFVGDATYPVDVQFGPDGSLYYLDLFGGTLRRVRYLGPSAVATATPRAGEAPLEVELDGRATTDPDDPLTALRFAWDLDGDGTYDDGATARLTHTYAQVGSHVARLRVSDPDGNADGAAVTIEAREHTPRCAGKRATVIGSGGADRLAGGGGRDVIVGAGGADRIKAGGGRDLLCAGKGADELRGGGGRDRLRGGGGDDRLRGGGGRDRLDGGPGTDTCVGGRDKRSRCEDRG
jgi:glucose/arabinose dehydrogenase